MRAKCLQILAVLLLPASVFAQASLTGTVRDASGGVLPGVTVEASSPALIEKVRTAVTDDSGQYRIIDLRAGTYTLAFSLPGFTAVRRENIVLSGSQARNVGRLKCAPSAPATPGVPMVCSSFVPSCENLYKAWA